MSNLLLPTLASPPNMSWQWPVKKTPSFKTIVQTPASQRGEVRIALQPYPVYDFEYDLSYIKGDFQTPSSQLAKIVAFYGLMQGAAGDWLFLDPYDNAATGALLGYGDGFTTAFQLGLERNVTGTFEPIQNLNQIQTFYINALSVAAMPNPVPASPATFQVNDNSPLGSRTDYFKVTWTLTSGESMPSAEVSVAVTATWSGGVAKPANPPVDAVAWNVYGSTSSGTETLVAANLSLSLTGYTEPLSGLPGGGRVVPTASNNWQLGVENFALYSQAFTQSVWAKVNVSSVTDNSITSPDGTVDASAIVFGSGSLEAIFQNIFQATAGETWTFSIWLKVPTGSVSTFIFLGQVNSAGSTIIGNSQFLPVTITTTWTRFSVTVTASGFGSPGMQIQVGQGATLSGSTIHSFGAQLERASIASGHLTTTNAAVQPKGLISLTTAPALANQVTTDFSYYYRCRFLDDEWNDLEEFLYQVWELKSLKFRSVIL